MTRTSLLLSALVVVSAATVGLTGAVASNGEPATSVDTGYGAQVGGTTEVPVTSDEVFWQGQVLAVDAGSDNASEVWAVRRVEDGEVGSLVTEMLLDGEGTASFSTAGLDGDFVVVDERERPVVFADGEARRPGDVNAADFEVAVQTLDASFEDDTVRNDDDPGARTDLQLTSNRAGYGVALFSEGLSPGQLAGVFPAAEARDDRAVVTRNVSSDEVLDANFTGIEPGTYDVTAVAAGGIAQDTATVTVSEPVEGSAGLSNATYAEQRGDVVAFTVTFDGTDSATVDVGSADIGYHVRFTVVDEDGDGTATVLLDTYRAGQSENAPGISVADGDAVTDATLLTAPLSDRLDAASYSIEVSVGASRTAVGSIRLTERSTEGLAVWTAPEGASVDSPAEIADVATQDADVAYQDWAIVEVEASGLYAYVENRSDLTDGTAGVSMSLTRVGEMNVPPEPVPLDLGELVFDEADDRFFLVLPTNGLDEETTYRASFNVTEANPYVEPGNATRLSTNFTVVERDVTIDEPVELSATSDAAVTGTSTVAPGTELQVEVSNVEDRPFLRRATATVGEDGAWEATVDLSAVPAGTNVTVDVVDPPANATGVIVDPGVTADGETTTETTPAEETTPGEETTQAETTQAETTPAGEDGVEADEAGGDEQATETTADGIGEGDADTTAGVTTTENVAATAPAGGFGPFAVGGGLAGLLALGLLAVRRR